VTTPNRTLLEKADLALADLVAGGGYLRPAQAQKFMLLTVKESDLLPLTTVVPMPTPKFSTSGLKMTGRVLRPAREATPLTEPERARPDVSNVELDAQSVKGQIDLNDEVLEDNIERGDFKQTVMTLLAKAVSRDMEDIVINGDRTSVDPTLAILDGIVVQSRSHVVDAAGARLNRDVLDDMLRATPSEFLRERKAMRFFVSHNAELDYRRALSARETVAGDKFVETDAPILHSGVPVTALSLLPENLGATRDQSVALLCNPKNIQVGIYRQIRIETDRDIEKGVFKVVVTMRFDVKWAEEPGTCKAIHLTV
jgi:hypothetical protein